MSLANATLLSLEIAVSATAAATLIAVPLSFLLSRRKFPGRAIVEALFMLPLVLPPTVVGYLLLVCLGRRSFIGRILESAFHYTFFMRVEAAVVASTIVAFPLIYIPARAAFYGVDRDLEDVARLAGASLRQVFFFVSLPLAARTLAAGALLAFARALGEFGATFMVYTWQQGHETLPLLIYADYESDEMMQALPAVLLLSVISLVLVIAYNRFLAKPR